MVREGPAEAGRGRGADRPREIPRAGWLDILRRTKDAIRHDHITIVAAGVAFYALLAIFPAIVAAISIWALAFEPQQLQQQIEQISALLPEQGAKIITDQARAVAGNAAGNAAGGVSLAAAGGVLFALYSASRGTKAMIEGLNVAYRETEARGFFRLNVVALALTLFGVLGTLVSLGLVAVLPALIGTLGLGPVGELLASWLRWPVLCAIAVLGLSAIYRYAPSRRGAKWRWIGWGAALATALWILVSILFSIYVRNFGSYNETYGTLGAVVVLLLWFWISALIVLVGAELDAEMERQTEEDTTTGAWRPRGYRGAYVADTVADET